MLTDDIRQNLRYKRIIVPQIEIFHYTMETSTISCFSSLIYLENFYCINRSYLISDRRGQIFWNILSIITFFFIIIAILNDIFNSEKSSLYEMFQGLLAMEFVILVLAARYRNVTFSALKILDEKCGVDVKYIDKLKRQVQKQTLLNIISIIIDIAGMYILGAKAIDSFMYLSMFAAHETETIFFALIIEGMNLRLMKLNFIIHSSGCRVYRHVLIASSQISEEFTHRVLLILVVILVTTVSYSCAILLMFSEKGMKLALYLLWRELKAMYCIWKLCRASSRSETICQQLTFQLAKKLAFDPAVNKDRNSKAYAIVHRWYTIMLRQRPRYVRGSILSLRLSVPFHLVDISINYVLIIIQIYVAYK